MDLKPNEVAVIELSSYQLETMVTPILEAATILNITPDHLDRYGNMENYAKAKSLIQKVMKNDAPLYLSQQVMKEYAHLFNENQRRIYYPRPEQPLLNASQPHDSTIVESRELSRSSKAVVPAADSINIRLFGYDPACFIYSDKKHIIFNQKIEYILPNSYRGIISHDVENIIAAYALCRQFGVTPQQFDHALQTFTKPPHRLQFVRCLNNITFIDDSKGTNVDAVIRAVESLEGPILLIAGGVDKGWSYYSWLQPFKNRVKAMYVIGQAAEKMVQELSIALAVHRCGTLAEAINAAHAEAEPGDIVLLSPGCASFDMFRDYAHRGEEFQRVVSAL
jgi:UDP-N-acetylmuramoylalanine--D-glutamate ligase